MVVENRICAHCGETLQRKDFQENRRVCESCRRERQRQDTLKWKKANPQKVKAQGKRYRKKHGDQIKEYREIHKEQISARRKERYIPHPRPILNDEERVQRRRELRMIRYYANIKKGRARSKSDYEKYYERHSDCEKERRRMQHIIDFFGGKEMLQHIPPELIELRKLHLTLVHEVNNNLKEANYG